MGCASFRSAGPPPGFAGTYKIGAKIGEGAFGQVRIAKVRATGEVHAVKIVDVRSRNELGECTSEVNARRLKLTKSELESWQEIGQHENCVRLFAFVSSGGLYYMFMEKCTCSLMDRLAEMSKLTKADFADTFRQMASGICHVHEKGIVHRDIKPDNFLFGGPHGATIKLCDFGLAVKMPKKGLLKGVYGTAPYMSPEMLLNKGYDQRTDVWSFGATAHILLVGDFPYSPKLRSPEGMKEAIRNDDPPLVLDNSTRPGSEGGEVGGKRAAWVWAFLQPLLRRNAAERFTASEVLQMELLSPEVSPKLVTFAPATMRRARQITREIKRPADPTVQKNIEELLRRAKSTASGHLQPILFFSESPEEDEEKGAESPEARIRRNSRPDVRHSTHSGIVSVTCSERFSPVAGSDIADSGEVASLKSPVGRQRRPPAAV